MVLEGVSSGTGRTSAILKKRSGLKVFTSVTSPIRKLYQTGKGRFFAINGNRVDEVRADGSVIARGTINTITGPVGVSDNGDEMIIVDGNTGFHLDLNSNVLASVDSFGSGAAFPNAATHITFQDSYFIANSPESKPIGQFFISGVFDGTSWNALDFANVEGQPDQLTALVSNGSVIWMLGTQSLQVYYNSGNSDFTFDTISGTLSDVGILAPFSLCKMNTQIFWLGSDDQGFGQVFMSQGYKPQRISNHALENEIRTYPDLELTTGFCFQELGHYFYVLSFPSQNITWVYDTSVNEWYQWAYTDYLTNTDGLYRGNSYAFFDNKNLVGDYASGDIFEVDPFTLTDNAVSTNNKIKCLRRSPHMWESMERTFYTSFQIDMETGVGLTTGQGSNPEVMLRWSKDGGHTFSSDHPTSAGKIGKYNKRVKWNRLGASRDRVWEVSITDPVKVTFLNAFIEGS